MLSLIIKPMCLHCKENIQKKFGLCEMCFDSLKEIDKLNQCNICNLPIKGEGTICERCFKAKDKFDSAYFLFPFEAAGRSLIHNIKFKDKIHFLKLLENYDKREMVEFFNDVDCITYIPSPYLTFAARGYNVSYEIAKFLGKQYKIPVVKIFKSNKLYKKRLSKTKHRADRKKIIKKFLELKKTDFNYNQILIVDDVFTTGITLNKASELIKNAKIAKKCKVFTLSRVV